MYTGDGAVSVTTMLLLVVPRVVLVTHCGATGRFGVVTLTASLFSSVYTLWILIILISINTTPKYVHWVWDGVVTLTAASCSSLYTPRIYMSFRRVHAYWYLNSLALRPNGWLFKNKFSATKIWYIYINIYIYIYYRFFPGIQIEKCQCWFRCWLGAV